jgi:Flp pilus assembly protein TadG
MTSRRQISIQPDAAQGFVADERGTALVEFAMVLPVMLILFAAIVEGSRMMMSFQSAIVGVRDAARFLARTVPSDICTTGGSVSSYASQLLTIVLRGTSTRSAFPPGVTVTSVTPSYTCVTGTYRISPAPVATVTASVTITYPFSGLLALVSGTLPTATVTITDQTRIFGS